MGEQVCAVWQRSVWAVAALCVSVAFSGCGSTQQSSAGKATTTTTDHGTPTVVTVQGTSQLNASKSAQYTALANGVVDTGVTWTVNGMPGGSVDTGTIDAQGNYAAPAAVPAANVVQIAATDTSSQQTGSVPVTLLQPMPAITSAALVSTDGGATGTLTVNATGLGTSIALLVDGADLGTAQTSDGLTATVSALAGRTSVSVAVQNSGPGQQTSGAQTVAVQTTAASARAAARLLAQSTFGPTADLIQQVQKTGLKAFLDAQFQQPASLLPDVPSPLPANALNNSATFVNCAWWNNVITGNDQLRQRTALALEEIFVVSENKTSAVAFPYYLNTLSKDAFGNWRTLMEDVTLSPAMGVYLDMLDSMKPATGQMANENYARELMQLFSLGINQVNQDGTAITDGSGAPVPNYTADQVQGFARAFTGWRLTKNSAGSGMWNVPMSAVDARHDNGSKTLLTGTVLSSGGTAQQDLDAALDNIFQQPSMPPFVSRQLIQHLVTSNPSPAYIRRVAAVFANNGSGVRGDMQAVLRAVLLDPEARALDDPNASDSTFGHLQEPIVSMAAIVRGTGFSIQSTDAISNWGDLNGYVSGIGQPAHQPPSVFGFFEPQDLLPGSTDVLAPEFGLENTSSVMTRLDFTGRILNGLMTNVTMDLAATSPWVPLGSDPKGLLDRVNTVFFSGGMPTATRDTIVNAITPMTDNAARARSAIFLAVTSSAFKIRR